MREGEQEDAGQKQVTDQQRVDRAQARRIRAPYQWHHGLLDYAVPFLLDKRLDAVLQVPHEGYLYPRLHHAEVAADPEMLARVRAWYAAHGMF